MSNARRYSILGAVVVLGGLGAGRTHLVKGGALSVGLPIFTDDIAVHVYK